MDKEITKNLLDFWFGEIKNELSSPEKAVIWYSSNADTDQYITSQYKYLLLESAENHDARESLDPYQQLALIILFDQFSRSIFRGTRQAFAYDHLALDLCVNGIEKGQDKTLKLIEKLFFYHPLEHSESLADQQHCVKLMEDLVAEYQAEQRKVAQNALKFAEQHLDIIARFGRFPHRNKALGRTSTAEELDYLNSGAQRFGQ